MLQTDRRPRAVIGFRIKSGWATAILLTGPIEAPVVRDATVIELSDPTVPGAKQPYHAGMGVARKHGPALERLLARASVLTRSGLSLHF